MAKTTKKIVLKMECTECKYRKQLAIKRCKPFELGGDKKKETPTPENVPVTNPVLLAHVWRHVAAMQTVQVTTNVAPMAAVTPVKRQFHRQEHGPKKCDECEHGYKLTNNMSCTSSPGERCKELALQPKRIAEPK
ncbi:hypothetical protein NP493_195g06019 [Ridgeia piscesae]|uniref:Uncharacterized protein n=1 Tax=Ridgeia piscesae TaxID=27915 RepID=A0AAD9P1X3_RIDPI|nr:hypothetical protein NP493_195g06019 [Ridgeia piscesae]